MDEKGIQLKQVDTTIPSAPPPAYPADAKVMTLPAEGQSPPAYHQASSARSAPTGSSVPFQPAGFQDNAPKPAQWYTGAQGMGLALLDDVQEVHVERMLDMLEAMIGSDTSPLKRQFRVINKDGQQLLFLDEDESLLTIQGQRAYHFKAKDSHGQVIFEVRRDPENCPCCYCCTCADACRSQAEIIDPLLGTICFLKQRFHLTSVRFALEESRSSDEVMRVIGNGNACVSPPPSYQLEMADGGAMGSLIKVGSPWGTALNKYTLKFPPNVNSQIKACCIGILIHFDFRYHIMLQRSR